jgi:hypothetical protein
MMQLIMPEILACPGQIHVLLHHWSNKQSCTGLLLLMASSNFKQPTVKDRKCSMKFPQHELTVHNNN